MNKEEFARKLAEFELDKEEFCILSGGSLLMQGLREKTNDFDLSMSDKLAKEISLYEKPKDEYGFYLPFPNVQAMSDFEKFDKVKVDGFWCESLEAILEFKKSKMREKDLADIRKIELVLSGFSDVSELVSQIRADFSDELLGVPTDIIGFSGVGKELAAELAPLVSEKEICFYDDEIKNDSMFHYLDFSDMTEKSRIMIFTNRKYLRFLNEVSKETKVYFIEEGSFPRNQKIAN